MEINANVTAGIYTLSTDVPNPFKVIPANNVDLLAKLIQMGAVSYDQLDKAQAILDAEYDAENPS